MPRYASPEVLLGLPGLVTSIMLPGDMRPPVQGVDTTNDPRTVATYDEVATLAAALCRTNHAMVLLLEPDRSWYRVSGLGRAGEPLLSAALCTLIAYNPVPLVIEDTRRDNRLLVDRALNRATLPHFLAGVAVRRSNGDIAGILVVTDRLPRTLSTDQEHGLDLLARRLSSYLDLLDYQHAYTSLTVQQESAFSQRQVSEELFRTFMNAGPFLSFLKDAAGRLLFYNRSYARHFGIEESTWLGRTDEQLWDREIATRRLSDAEVMRGDGMVAAEEQLEDANGVVTHWKTYRFPCQDRQGNLLLAGLAMDVSDETERKQELERFQEEMQQANEQLRRLSVTDELTGLRNRRAFEERLVVEFSIARRRRRDLAVLLLDVDNFKQINDRGGHDAGDAVLRRLAALLQTTLRVPDLAARYGGEEFVVLLPESGVEGGRGFARRFMSRMAAEAWDNAPVTVSMGLATLNDTLFNGFQLVSMADEALYAAKRQGKDRLVTYEESSGAAIRQLG